MKVQWVHFPLHPDTPAEGQTLEDLFEGRDIDVEAMRNRMYGLMEQEGLPHGPRTHTYNSRLAQELGKWADSQAGGEAVHDALYRAYFVNGRNIGEVDVLVAVAELAGLSGDAARTMLTERSFRAAVDEDWSKSRKYGVTGVPTFVAGGQALVGAQPYNRLEQLLEAAGAQRR